ncbi:DUF4166 domain-containing protein [Chengkuizengella marina]|uniref:DUF4166 domain-containing protein n=1 Tax=Chengkuizengella marina TaxID=2507566 RepID=A0A6N9PYR0_9BACL|nr:DUF4166 domain-containing protein [Chengkuizengella marina]NBI27765.1 DUF4166 domain-containing protein [Chengkuizengella marina]
MTSIYEKAMGKSFYNLHPKLQKRYTIVQGGSFQASGIMKNIQRGPNWLYPLFLLGLKRKLLFPDQGKNIPFTMVNEVQNDKQDKQEIVRWERVFHFKKKQRIFTTITRYDDERNIIIDYLGEPSLFSSDLDYSSTDQGDLKIKTINQRILLGRFEIPLPKILQGSGTVIEKYLDDKDVYYVQVEIRNPMVGILFKYEGEFTQI